jgi:hypothetical protein
VRPEFFENSVAPRPTMAALPLIDSFMFISPRLW